MDIQLFEGLHSLLEDSFPKKCATCGKVYHSSAQFFKETTPPAMSSKSLKSSFDDEIGTVVEAYRNCSCGSTLMDVFSDRRDASEKGVKRREKFDRVLTMFVEKGMERQEVKSELLKFIRTGQSTFFDRHLKN